MPRILIADDNETLRNALKKLLSDDDKWNVCGEASNGQEAVALAATLKPDAVLLDFMMPTMNGLDAAKEILKNDPSVPVAMYTLHQNTQLEAHARRFGVRKVISKTEIFNSLKASLEEILAPATIGPLQVPEDVSIPPELPIDPTEMKKPGDEPI
jgi:DNA-binding NarL/FixJ family response regulator